MPRSGGRDPHGPPEPRKEQRIRRHGDKRHFGLPSFGAVADHYCQSDFVRQEANLGWPRRRVKLENGPERGPTSSAKLNGLGRAMGRNEARDGEEMGIYFGVDRGILDVSSQLSARNTRVGVRDVACAFRVSSGHEIPRPGYQNQGAAKPSRLDKASVLISQQYLATAPRGLEPATPSDYWKPRTVEYDGLAAHGDRLGATYAKGPYRIALSCSRRSGSLAR
ncbi:hypothetical protein AK830_g3988 [Neonectria ditissima]|uniref:Uncharacterized protein n=1 Tax=Neonectria ditissima TaxID=78410 RepID=A0A0P7BMH4_9HYPO|nr:hypothetical protein AK830_g3988 [Neonectria ditissima]